MKPNPLQLHRIRSTLLFQFPDLAVDEVLGNVAVTLSGKTKRIRSIYDSSKSDILLFSLRTSDGRFMPTYEGGRRIIGSGYKKNRIIMSAEATPFVARGKSAFCKHVIEVDNNIVPGSEVFVLDENYNLLSVGTSLHPAYAILELESGPAIKVKHYK